MKVWEFRECVNLCIIVHSHHALLGSMLSDLLLICKLHNQVDDKPGVRVTGAGRGVEK